MIVSACWLSGTIWATPFFAHSACKVKIAPIDDESYIDFSLLAKASEGHSQNG
jgi:hypothetical protein